MNFLVHIFLLKTIILGYNINDEDDNYAKEKKKKQNEKNLEADRKMQEEAAKL